MRPWLQNNHTVVTNICILKRTRSSVYRFNPMVRILTSDLEDHKLSRTQSFVAGFLVRSQIMDQSYLSIDNKKGKVVPVLN
jgi:hypothetical protein